MRHEALEADARRVLRWLGMPVHERPLPRTHEGYAAHNDTWLDERGARLLRQQLAAEYAMMRRVMRHAVRLGQGHRAPAREVDELEVKVVARSRQM